MKKIDYLLIVSIVSSIFVIGAFVWTSMPHELPPDGVERHTWHITVYAPSGDVLIYNGRPQDYFSDTANIRRNFNNAPIEYRWFGNPTIRATDSEGNTYIAELVK